MERVLRTRTGRTRGRGARNGAIAIALSLACFCAGSTPRVAHAEEDAAAAEALFQEAR
jgi:hypothetical protein